jgi:hypothetical protein
VAQKHLFKATFTQIPKKEKNILQLNVLKTFYSNCIFLRLQQGKTLQKSGTNTFVPSITCLNDKKEKHCR